MTGFTLFHLVHGFQAFIPIECEILTLHIALHLLLDTTSLEKHLLSLKNFDGDHRNSLQHNEAHET